MAKKVSTRRVTNSFLVGLFVIVGSLLIVGVAIWLGASQFLKENVPYVTYFDGSVEGLESGSEVKYQGLPVGTVSSVRIAPNGKLIEVVMSIREDVDISDSMRVKSEMSGLAGGKFLQIFYPGNIEIAEMYPRINFEPPHPVIRSSPSGFEELETAARVVMNNLRELDFGKISREAVEFLQATSTFMESGTKFLNTAEFEVIFNNFKDASYSAKNILRDADSSKIIANLEAASLRLQYAAIRMEDFADGLNKQIEGLNIPERTGNVYAKIDSLLINTRDAISVLAFRTESVLFNLNETLHHFKKTNNQIDKSLREITDNPAQIFFSEPPEKER